MRISNKRVFFHRADNSMTWTYGWNLKPGRSRRRKSLRFWHWNNWPRDDLSSLPAEILKSELCVTDFLLLNSVTIMIQGSLSDIISVDRLDFPNSPSAFKTSDVLKVHLPEPGSLQGQGNYTSLFLSPQLWDCCVWISFPSPVVSVVCVMWMCVYWELRSDSTFHTDLWTELWAQQLLASADLGWNQLACCCYSCSWTCSHGSWSRCCRNAEPRKSPSQSSSVNRGWRR